MTSEQYARQLKQLLPQGAAVASEPSSWLGQVMLALADELSRVDSRVTNLLDEFDPRTALEMLDDWERALSLPDGCLVVAPVTISERRTAILNKYAARGGQSRQYYIDLAVSLGYEITINEFDPFHAGSLCGDLCYGTDWAYAWQVNVDLAAPEGLPSFRAGSRAGDYLFGLGELDVECIFMRARPAHTYLLFNYTG
jgi:uncharacterized protein YmfQ (DUF2313 family)